MTDDLNRRIAEARGWSALQQIQVGGAWHGKNPDSLALIEPVPDWEHDGNAMLELLGEMRAAGREVILYSGINSWHANSMIIGRDADVSGCGDTLPAAVAAAWIAWKEGGG